MDNKFKIFVVSAFIVLFAGMVAGGFFIFKNISNKEPASQVQTTAAKHPKDIVVFPISGDITTNLTSENDGDRKHVIKITVGFGVDKKSKDFKDVATEFAEKELIIRNEIIQSLRNQSYESMAKSDAQEKLSEIIVSRLSTLLFTDSIEEMYFGDFFVQ